ncbi:MAG: hypothetical protein K6T29_03105 [Peptococcaceae bacterium]|nr:hypothetical protein [Peptococcaceae bacterium]
MFEVIRYRNRGEFTYHYMIIPYGTACKPEKKQKELAGEMRRYGPFPTEAEARDFIYEVEKDTH